MTAPVYFNLSAAQDAQARADEGVDLLPGDKELMAAYEGFLQQEWDRYWEVDEQARLADWLAEQCPACEDGGMGPLCDDCAEEPA